MLPFFRQPCFYKKVVMPLCIFWQQMSSLSLPTNIAAHLSVSTIIILVFTIMTPNGKEVKPEFHSGFNRRELGIHELEPI